MRYSIRLVGAYLSRLSGRNITGAAAVFSVFVAIAFELLSAVFAGKRVVGLSVDRILVVVPPIHPAAIRAELLLPATLGLHQRLTTILTSLGTGNVPVAVDVRTNGAGRQAQLSCDLGRTVSLQPHIVNGDLILQFHSDTPSV